MNELKDLFLLDKEVVFLNHGSYGACPKPVFEVYQEFQRQLECQPVEFLGRNVMDMLAESREALGEYLGVSANDVVYFPNPTTAINMVARSLNNLLEGFYGKPIQPGDHILTTDHEYGALDRTWQFTCEKLNIEYTPCTIQLPVTNHDVFVEHFWTKVNEGTRIIYLSHISSPTALIFPVEEICRRARQAGILCIVDGAHAVGQIPLDLKQIGADIYTGACHKWLSAPKGSAVLYVRPELQEYLDPLVVSWGYQADEGYGTGHSFIDYHEWQGTRDMAAFLAVPAAIEFQHQQGWEIVQEGCSKLARETRRRINALTGLSPICPEDSGWYRQMFSVRLPDEIDTKKLGKRLYEDFQIEVPVIDWNMKKLLRVSIQGYNDQSDADTLLTALESIL